MDIVSRKFQTPLKKPLKKAFHACRVSTRVFSLCQGDLGDFVCTVLGALLAFSWISSNPRWLNICLGAWLTFHKDGCCGISSSLRSLKGTCILYLPMALVLVLEDLLARHGPSRRLLSMRSFTKRLGWTQRRLPLGI